ncbi:MAG TPA: hypothetical protein VNT03_18750 [Baekduia sp.]|nr:hypothetical protein [Baekduia sp.]
MRRTFAALSFILACVLPAAGLTTWWAYGQATDTARFTATARPLATEPAVQREVVDELVAVARSRLAAVPVAQLPGGKAVTRARIRDMAEALVRTRVYRDAWLRVQRTGHARLAARLAGDVSAPLTIDLAPIARALRARVARNASLAPVVDAIADPDPVLLLDRAEVRRARDATDTVRIVRGIAIPGAVVALIVVVLTAPGVGRGLLRAGLSLAVSAGLLVLARSLARDAVSSPGAAGRLRVTIYDVLTDGLHAWVVGALGAAVALVIAGAVSMAVARRPPRAPARSADMTSV